MKLYVLVLQLLLRLEALQSKLNETIEQSWIRDAHLLPQDRIQLIGVKPGIVLTSLIRTAMSERRTKSPRATVRSRRWNGMPAAPYLADTLQQFLVPAPTGSDF